MSASRKSSKLAVASQKSSVNLGPKKLSTDTTPIIINNVVSSRPSSPNLIRSESPKNTIISIDKSPISSPREEKINEDERKSPQNHRRSLSPTRGIENNETSSSPKIPSASVNIQSLPDVNIQSLPDVNTQSLPDVNTQSLSDINIQSLPDVKSENIQVSPTPRISPNRQSPQKILTPVVTIPEPQNVKTSSPQNVKTSSPQNVKSSSPQKTLEPVTIPETQNVESPSTQTRRQLTETSYRRGGPQIKQTTSPSANISVEEDGRLSPSLTVRKTSVSPVSSVSSSPVKISASPIKVPSLASPNINPPQQILNKNPVILNSAKVVKNKNIPHVNTRNVVDHPNNSSTAKTVTLKRTTKQQFIDTQDEDLETEISDVDSELEDEFPPSPPIKRRTTLSPINIRQQPAPTVVASPTSAPISRGPPETIAAPTAAQPPGTVRPNYRSMEEEEQQRYRTEFNVKLGILRRSFPEYNFSDFPDNASLDAIHDIYAGYVKQVVIALNCSQYRIFLIIMFLALEAFGVKVLKLNMGGFTLSQLRTLNRYDSILIELGEKYYFGGLSSWSPEARLIFMGVTSALTFIVVKYLANYIGGEAAMQPIQSAIESFMSGGTFSMASATSLPAGVPAIPTGAPAPQPAAAAAGTAVPSGTAGTSAVPETTPAQGGGFDIMGLLNGFMGGNGNESIKDMIAKVGSTFINSTGQPAANVAAAAAPAGSAPRRQPRFKTPSSTN